MLAATLPTKGIIQAVTLKYHGASCSATFRRGLERLAANEFAERCIGVGFKVFG
jgi:hypothetical protein